MHRIGLGLIMSCLWLTTAANGTDYRVVAVSDSVYRFSAGHYHSVFMVSEAGIFLTDPLNPEAATWLRRELSERFEVPVRYLAYSHNHIDHTRGGDVFDTDAVTVIAQERAAEDLRWTQAPTAMPELTFDDFQRIDLGDHWVEMRYHGPNNGHGSVSFRFMPDKVLYVVDWIVLGRMPYQDLPGYDLHGMIHSTQAVLDGPAFDRFVGGHADMGQREDVERYLAYLRALYAAVRDGMLAGKPLSTLQREIKLEAFSDLAMFDDWLPMNIAGAYRQFNDRSYFHLRATSSGTENNAGNGN